MRNLASIYLTPCQLKAYKITLFTIPMLSRNPDTGIVSLIGGDTARAGVDFTDPNIGLVKVDELLPDNASETAAAPKYLPG